MTSAYGWTAGVTWLIRGGCSSLRRDRRRLAFVSRSDSGQSSVRAHSLPLLCAGSLELVYEYTALVIARESWDAVAGDNGAVSLLGQRTCLGAATTFVDFICNLVKADLEGYWISRESSMGVLTCPSLTQPVL